jgi:hypothetical protein
MSKILRQSSHTQSINIHSSSLTLSVHIDVMVGNVQVFVGLRLQEMYS